jgi:hypothetical protein
MHSIMQSQSQTAKCDLIKVFCAFYFVVDILLRLTLVVGTASSTMSKIVVTI